MNEVYYVIKFDRPPKKSLDRYLCVPASWTRVPEQEPDEEPHSNSRRVRVWYPLETTKRTAFRVESKESPDMKNWGMYMATVPYIGDYYGAIGWIKNNHSLARKINTDILNMLRNQITGANTAEDNPSSLDQRLPFTSETSSEHEFAIKTEAVCTEYYEVIEDDSDVDDESSSSPIDCLKTMIQKLLQEIEKVTKEQHRFEFNEIRCVRERDGVVMDVVPELTIKLNGVVDDAATDNRQACIRQEVTSTSDRRNILQGQCAIPPPQPSISVSPPTRSPRSVHPPNPTTVVAPSHPSTSSGRRVSTPSDTNGRAPTLGRLVSPNHITSPHPTITSSGGRRHQYASISGCTARQGLTTLDIPSHVQSINIHKRLENPVVNGVSALQTSINLGSITLTPCSGSSTRRLGDPCEDSHKRRRT